MAPADPPNLSRIRQGIGRRAADLRHRGSTVTCPVCGHSFGAFKPAGGRAGVLCWWCGAHERHRAQWLLLERRPELLARTGRLLHFAPEWALRHRLETVPGIEYVTADLTPEGVDLRLDLTALDLPDASFDAVLCSHVLEHIEDDGAAMRELRRVTRPGGWCLVMVPLDLGRTESYEDPAIVTPEARERAFLQHDHVRLYAGDIAGRLEAAGFAVECIRPRAEFGADGIARYGVIESDHIWLCHPRAATGEPTV